MKYLAAYFCAIVLMLFSYSLTYSQIKGGEIPDFKPDSTIIFNSPRPLLVLDEVNATQNTGLGIDILFSGSGFGAGAFWQRELASSTFLQANLLITGARNTDEIEYYNPQTGQYVIPNKVNRLFNIPLTLGVQQNILENVISESFKPFFSAGLGASTIISTPYSKSFFSAFGDAKSYLRFSSFIGVGAEFSGNKSNRISRLNIRYYYIPFGSEGLESLSKTDIIDDAGNVLYEGVSPIKDFGGLFITLSIGTKF